MKKLTILAFCSIMMFGASSCEKEWTCTCTDGTDSESAIVPGGKISRKDANKFCDAFETSGVTCSVK